MARLANLKPSLKLLPPALSYGGDQSQIDARRERIEPWRAWYRLKRWAELREIILIRDLYTCQRTGVLLIGTYPAPDSPVIHHIRRHHGNPELFWDPDNLQAVSKQVHDSELQAEERRVPKGVWY